LSRSSRPSSRSHAWRNTPGKRVTKCARTPIYEAAKKTADKLEAEAVLRRNRVIDPREEAVAAQSAKPIAEHFSDYRSKLKSTGRDTKYTEGVLNKLREIAGECSFATAADIDADVVTRFAVRLQDKGRSARTIQDYRGALKTFTKWLTVNGKLLSDPLLTVK
jgi:hypothetical protein